MQIVIPTFPRLTALDAVGPYEVLQRVPGAEVVFAGVERGPVRTDNGMLGLVADVRLDEVPTPGCRRWSRAGSGPATCSSGGPVVDWVRSGAPRRRPGPRRCAPVRWCSRRPECSTGSTPSRTGRRWTLLGELGAVPTPGRYHVRGKVITAAGVSAGIDMALWLATQLADEDTAKVIQLYLEYEPEPPFHEGSLATASPRTIEAGPRVRSPGPQSDATQGSRG